MAEFGFLFAQEFTAPGSIEEKVAHFDNRSGSNTDRIGLADRPPLGINLPAGLIVDRAGRQAQT